MPPSSGRTRKRSLPLDLSRNCPSWMRLFHYPIRPAMWGQPPSAVRRAKLHRRFFHVLRHTRCSPVTDAAPRNVDNSLVTPDALTRSVQDFLSEASGAVVLEDGAVAFDLGPAQHSISGDYNKCLLHLWSAERNTVRRGLDTEIKNGTLNSCLRGRHSGRSASQPFHTPNIRRTSTNCPR
jgi:hypothetical protein